MVEQRHPEEDLLVELALGHVQGDRREELTAHLAGCATCRREYGEIAGSVELVLPAVPRSAPPSGFDAEVLAALDDARADRRPPFPGRTDRLPGRTDRRERRRPLLLAAASVLVGIAVGAGVATGLGERDEVAPAASSQWEAPLVDSGGDNVGTVTHSWSTDGPALVVQIDEGSVGYRYTCRLILADGNTEEVGEWQLAQGRPNSWVVPAPDGEVEVVEMVTTGGQVWSTAEF